MPQPAKEFRPAPTGAYPVWVLAVLLGVATIAVYWPATRCGFVNFDDDLYVTANVHVQNGLTWEDIKWLLVHPVASNWHPLTMLSHMLDCQIFDSNPWGHHLSSVLLHAFNAALVFVLLRQMTGTTWRSGLVAALFAVHPLRVESVAWIAERKDVLSGFWGLLSLIFYARYARKRSIIESPVPAAREVPALEPRHGALDYGLALFFFALGLMSKAMLVTWPLIMLLLDYWPLERFFAARARRLVWEKIPFFALAMGDSVVTLAVQHHAGAMAAVGSLPLGARGANALMSYCRYLGKLFCPVNLAVFYPLPGHWPRVDVLLAGAVLFGISVLFLMQWRNYPFLLMGWLWFCGMLLPVLGLVQVGDQSMADRYTYLPSLGVLVLAVWGASELARRWHFEVIASSLAASAAILLCITLTQQQLAYWQDSEALFRHALAVTANNHIAHNNLGVVLENRGEFDEAIRQFQEAILFRSDDAPAHVNLGNALFKKGQFDEAIRQYQEAIRLEPHDASAGYSLGNAYYKKGQFDEAIRQYQEAIRLKPDDATAHYNFGKCLDKMGHTDEAIRQYQEAIRLKPDYAEAHNNLGYALQSQGHIDEAISQYQEAIRAKPDYALARNNLAHALELKNTPAGR